MQQLTGLDASFLNLETATAFTHVSSLSHYDTGGRCGEDFYQDVRGRVLERLHLLTPFRRKLVTVPFDLDHPYWVEDAQFDIDFHVRHVAVPPPGGDRELAELVAHLVARPVDRARPLWELYVIDGLRDGHCAVLNKVHHATIDGASGVELLTVLLDAEPDPAPAGAPPTTITGEQPPSQLNLFVRSLGALATRPEKSTRLVVRSLRQLAATTRNEGWNGVANVVAAGVPGPVGQYFRRRARGVEVDVPPVLPTGAAPRTSFNRTITAHRSYAYCSTPLDEAKAIKTALGVTLNDVVMGACAGALRRYLLERHELPARPLVAMVPVSVRSGSESDTYSNRVSGMLVSLATNIEDPIERLRTINQSSRAAKDMLSALPAGEIMDLATMMPGALAARAARLAARTRVADRLRPPFNLIISNVPGPRVPLYLAGAKLETFYPVSAVTDGQGMNITVQSYVDHLDFGIIACRELVPPEQVWRLIGHLRDELSETAALVKEQDSTTITAGAVTVS